MNGTARPVGVDADGLVIDGEHVPVFSGELHYWRLDPGDWGRALDAVGSLGFGVLSAYFPWSRHERATGEFDFSSGSLDVRRLISMVAERDLKLIVRPGPNAGAELEDSGWPRRILDDPECQARRPDGRPYLLPTSVFHARMPSYASKKTLWEVGRWYDAVVPLLAGYQWPDGPIVASHVDNEMGFHFQGHAFALDYHPDALDQWGEFLQDHYGELPAVAAAYGTPGYRSWSDVPPPRDGRDQPERRRLDWVEFREHHLRRSIATLAGMLRDRGMDRVPLVHNDYPRTTTPLDTGALERSGAVDVAAGDIYSTRQGGRYVRDYCRFLSGGTSFPYLAEMGSGWLTLPWLFPMVTGPLDVEHTTWRALTGGIRGFNVFMLVERDRWFGSPITARGETRPELARFFEALLATLRRIDWPHLRRRVDVLFLENRAEGRRSAAVAVRGDLVPAVRPMLPVDRRLFDGADQPGRALAEWDRTAKAAVDAAGLDWDSVSSDAIPDDLSGYAVVVLPVWELADETLLERLTKAAASGVNVIVGPHSPAGDHGFTVLEDPARIAGAFAAVPPLSFSTIEPSLDLTYLAGGGREVLVAINAGAEPLEADVIFEGFRRLTGLWRPEELSGDGRAAVSLPAWGVQVYEVSG